MKEINLTKGQTMLVDEDDFERFSKFNCNAMRHRTGKFYACRSVKGICTLIHREIMGVTDPRIKVDHINGNPLDNRRANLRLCTNAENMMNRGPARNNTTGYKGVSYAESNANRRWVAQIKAFGRVRFIGSFHTKEQAAEAYNKAATELHGEFAWLNEI